MHAYTHTTHTLTHTHTRTHAHTYTHTHTHTHTHTLAQALCPILLLQPVKAPHHYTILNSPTLKVIPSIAYIASSPPRSFVAALLAPYAERAAFPSRHGYALVPCALKVLAPPAPACPTKVEVACVGRTCVGLARTIHS